MTDGIDIKGAVPTVMIAAALGAGAAFFTDRGAKKALTFGLVGAGVGAFAHLVLGVSLTGRGGHAVGQTFTERSHTLPPLRFATWPQNYGRIRARGEFEVGQTFTERTRSLPSLGRTLPSLGRSRVRARGDFGVGFDGDDDLLDDYDVCPLGYTLDAWGMNCVPVVFSVEREILYLYPEIILQYPELRLHPDRLFRFRPELRQRYANVHSANEMRARYQQVHRQPPPARPKDAPPASKAATPAQGAAAQPAGGGHHGKHAAQQAAAQAQSAQAAPPSAPMSPPPAHSAMTPPPLPSSPTSKQPPPQTPPSAHTASGWYTPGWQRYFPPIAYEYDHYGPMEYWWTT